MEKLTIVVDGDSGFQGGSLSLREGVLDLHCKNRTSCKLADIEIDYTQALDPIARSSLLAPVASGASPMTSVQRENQTILCEGDFSCNDFNLKAKYVKDMKVTCQGEKSCLKSQFRIHNTGSFHLGAYDYYAFGQGHLIVYDTPLDMDCTRMLFFLPSYPLSLFFEQPLVLLHLSRQLLGMLLEFYQCRCE